MVGVCLAEEMRNVLPGRTVTRFDWIWDQGGDSPARSLADRFLAGGAQAFGTAMVTMLWSRIDWWGSGGGSTKADPVERPLN